MTTKNIQDIVTEFFEKQNDIWKSEAGYSIADCKIKERELLTQLVKEVEEGEQDRILQELKDETNNWKGTISHLTIEGIVTNWRDYENVYHDDRASDEAEER